jgi:hypothetical protein
MAGEIRAVIGWISILRRPMLGGREEEGQVRADLKSVCPPRHTCRQPTQCPFSDSAPEPHHQLARFAPRRSPQQAGHVRSSHSILPTLSAPAPVLLSFHIQHHPPTP